MNDKRHRIAMEVAFILNPNSGDNDPFNGYVNIGYQTHSVRELAYRIADAMIASGN